MVVVWGNILSLLGNVFAIAVDILVFDAFFPRNDNRKKRWSYILLFCLIFTSLSILIGTKLGYTFKMLQEIALIYVLCVFLYQSRWDRRFFIVVTVYSVLFSYSHWFESFCLYAGNLDYEEYIWNVPLYSVLFFVRGFISLFVALIIKKYHHTLAEIESERASRTYSDIDDSVGGHVSYNAFQLISMYCAYQGEDDYTKISLSNLSEQIQAHRTEYYTYTISEEVRTEPVQKEVRGQTITVQEDHTYTIFTLSYVGDDYFADTVWQLDDKQKSYADAYAHNLTVYLHEIEEREGITILGQINDSLIDDNSPAPSGGFGNPFNDPNWEQHITSFFGKREDVGIPGKDTTNHNGLDIAYPYGTPILAVEAGTVIKAGYHVSYGNYLVINHGGGYCTLYAHCSQLLAQVGDTVNKYDTIAKVGATGDVTGNHLHICVIIDGVYVNPKGYLH